MPDKKTILIFGDSITAGYGVEPEQAFPAQLQKKIDDAALPYRIVNAGVSGDTTAGGTGRIKWALRAKPAILVLALGGNDGLRGIPPPTMKANLQRIIDIAKKEAPGVKILLAGMRMPPNYGEDYRRRFAAVFPDLARKNKLPLIPFFLEGVGGVAEMNLPDRIHPTPQGHQRIAENVWTAIQPLL